MAAPTKNKQKKTLSSEFSVSSFLGHGCFFPFIPENYPISPSEDSISLKVNEIVSGSNNQNSLMVIGREDLYVKLWHVKLYSKEV